MTRDVIDAEVKDYLDFQAPVAQEITRDLRRWGCRLVFGVTLISPDTTVEKMSDAIYSQLGLYSHTSAAREFASRFILGPWNDGTADSGVGLWMISDDVLGQGESSGAPEAEVAAMPIVTDCQPLPVQRDIYKTSKFSY